MTLIGILGKKRHGKNTLASIIQSYNKTYVIDAFGDDLKILINNIFKSYINPKFFTEEYKDAPFGLKVNIDDFLPEIEAATGLKLFRQDKIAYSYRDLLTMIGTEYIRAVNDNYWVDKVIDRIRKNNPASVNCNVVIADVRFRIEANAIRKLGGKLVKIIKINHDNSNSVTDPSFTHRSETEQDSIYADLTIGSLHNNLTIPTIVGFHIANNHWEEALKYNWD